VGKSYKEREVSVKPNNKLVKKLLRRKKQINDGSHQLEDPDPSDPKWTGEYLVMVRFKATNWTFKNIDLPKFWWMQEA
jgi:hypothetical protein